MTFILICSNLIRIATAFVLPVQCTSATIIADATRNVGYGSGSGCDQSGALASTGWYRFSGASGTMLVSYAVAINLCDTSATGWYTGAYPSTPGTTTTGTVCYNWNGNTCNWSNSVSVTNCNGYYVFYLSPSPACNLRYCTV